VSWSSSPSSPSSSLSGVGRRSSSMSVFAMSFCGGKEPELPTPGPRKFFLFQENKHRAPFSPVDS
jgi:hypothetical protein